MTHGVKEELEVNRMGVEIGNAKVGKNGIVRNEFIFEECPSCSERFFYNPNYVPTVQIAKPEIICLNCLRELNRYLETKGQASIEIPKGSYEPLPDKPT